MIADEILTPLFLTMGKKQHSFIPIHPLKVNNEAEKSSNVTMTPASFTLPINYSKKSFNELYYTEVSYKLETTLASGSLLTK